MSSRNDENLRTYPDGLPLDEQLRWKQDFPTDEEADHGLARREFARFMTLTSGAFVAGQGWIATMSSTENQAAFPEHRIADEIAVPPGGTVEFRYPNEDEPCLLIRLPDGRLVAYLQKCPHLACAVIPHTEQGHLKCPCHNGYFEIAEGRPTAGPPRRPLPRVNLVVRDGGIYAVGVEYRTV